MPRPLAAVLRSALPFGVVALVAVLAPRLAAAQAADGPPPEAQARLWDAAIAGDTTAIRQALADGADVNALDTRRNQNGRRALNWAAWHDHVPALRVLLAHGADLEATNRTGFTPLHHAAEAGAVEALRLLLSVGADPEHRNNRGFRPIDTARANGHAAVVAILKEAGE